MPLWSSGVTWSSGALWSPAPPAGASRVNSHPHSPPKMMRDDFYPNQISEQADWHLNFAAKFPLYGAILGKTALQINNAVADNLTLAYGLGEWRTSVREFGPASTASLELLKKGTGGDPFAFTTYAAPTPPTLPVGAEPVLAGALDRTFGLIKGLKGEPSFTLPMGLDMGIVGPEAPPPPPPGEVPVPEITVTAISGTENQYGRVKFVKNGHEYVIIECRINGGAYVELGMANKSPFIDNRPLLVPGVAEIREYRARYYDNAAPSSGWCGPEKVTVGP